MTAFWEMKEPVRAYLLAFQQFAGVQATGVWDAASHAALYKMASAANTDVMAETPWGGEPAKTVEYLLGLAQDTDDQESFTFARPFLVLLGFPVMSFEEMGRWTSDLDPKVVEAINTALAAVAEYVGQAELVGSENPANVPIDAQPVSPASPDPAATTPAPSPSVVTVNDAGEVETVPPAAPPAPPAPPPTVTIVPVVPPAPGMSRGKKIAIGVGIGLGVVAIGTTLWLVLRKKSESQPPAGLGEMGPFGDFTVMDTTPPMGECPCKKAKKRAAKRRK